MHYRAKPIGSAEHVTRKLTELKLSRSSDPDYLIFVGIDRFGECFLAAFSTIGDPLEFRARHEKQLDRATERLLPAGTAAFRIVVVGHGRLAEIQFRPILERRFRSGGDAEAKGALFPIKRSPGNSENIHHRCY